ncbi:MAG TPA: hypothetical protein VHA06_03150, partial [Candidatus Angelobacter sp.]|nr:hypothetical protein [Candidatus Angelobacter sp.]
MPILSLNPQDVASAQLNINLPLGYGFVRARGNEVLNHALINKNRVVIRILSEGEMDGIERLWINSALANSADTTLVHFHPGVDGTLGAGLNPQSTGRPPGAVNGNLIINGDGETGVVGSQAPNWILLNGSSLVVANDFSHSGLNSLKVTSTGAADCYSYQEVSVVDGATYRLQGWIKTTAIAASAGHGAVLNIDIVAGVTGFTIVSKTGTDFSPTQPDVGIAADGAAHGFTFVSCIFRPVGSGIVRLYLQLGYGVGLVGSAWFDDVQIFLADQDVDSFWSLVPANFIPTTFSRKAYLMLNVPPDPAAPTATLDIIADLRGCKVRQFDAAGNQTGYAFSTNGAEQVLDVILRTMLKPEWNPILASAPGGDLVAAEKARINFAAFADSVNWCNTVLASGQKRFESSLAFTQQTSVQDALNQLLAMSQLYITEAAGQIYICADKPRTSTFLLTSDHVLSGQTQFDKINLHGANNRFIGNFNDLNAQDAADLDTPANSALVRTGNGIVTAKFLTDHPFQINGNVQIVPPQDGSTHDTGFDGVFQVSSIPASNKIAYAQSGHANWLLHSEEFDNAVWTKQTGVTVTPNTAVDPIGGNTADTISTGSTSDGVFQSTSLVSQNGVQVTFSVWLRAAANVAATLQVVRSGADLEQIFITVTPVWQRFIMTHSPTWTAAAAVQANILIAATSSIFAWGAQIEDGTVATQYRQTTSGVSGSISGNGYAGSPESRFAVRAPIVDHEQHQNAIGQRGLSLTPIFHVSPVTYNLGNNTYERVNRILNFLSARNLGLPQIPYLAPWSGTVTCFLDAVDTSIPGNPRTLIEQLCGDIITVDATVSEEYQGDYEIMQAEYTVPAADGTSSDGSQQDGPTIQLTLLQYEPAAFSDGALPFQPVRVSIPSGLVPLSAVDPTGVLRLKGTFRNNPVNSNGILTGANPLSQSGTSTTILLAACVIQFGDGPVAYNTGSINPGSLGQWCIYCKDPNFAGGPVILLFTQNTHIKTSDNGIVV